MGQRGYHAQSSCMRLLQVRRARAHAGHLAVRPAPGIAFHAQKKWSVDMCGRPRVCREAQYTPKCFACADQDTSFKYFGVLIVRSEDVSGGFLILSPATGQPEHGSACAGDGEKRARGGKPSGIAGPEGVWRGTAPQPARLRGWRLRPLMVS